MNATVKEWVDKAEGDFGTATREAAVTVDPNFDAVCYHCQQCIEKLMKAVLIQAGLLAPRTHELGQLDARLPPLVVPRTWSDADLQYLTRTAVDVRYPGETADHSEANQCLALCARMRHPLLATLTKTADC